MAPHREFITLGRGCAWVDSRVTAYLPHSLASIARRGGTYAHEWSLSEKSWFRGKKEDNGKNSMPKQRLWIVYVPESLKIEIRPKGKL